MKIALDIDGVLADIMPVLNVFYNRTHGTNYKVEDYQHHDLEKTWGGTKEEAIKVVEEFYQSPSFLNIGPISGSPKAIHDLSGKHFLFSVTSRPKSIEPKTLTFLQKNFQEKIKKVFHTGQYIHSAGSINKFDICASEKAELLVEDCLETAIDCANRGLKTFLLVAPHNQLNENYSEEELPNNLVRVKDWREIVERLK